MEGEGIKDMFCRNCGKENPESAKFCPKCGTQVKE